MNRTWFKLEAGYFKKELWIALGAPAMMCHLYLQEYSKVDATTEEGWVSSILWNCDCIWNWLGCLQSRFTKPEIKAAMTQINKRKIITQEPERVRLSDFNDEIAAIKRADGRARTTKSRSNSKGKPSKPVTSECDNVTTESYKVTSECYDVTQREEREEKREREEQPPTDLIDTTQKQMGFDGIGIQPGTNAEKIQEKFPNMLDKTCKNLAVKLAIWAPKVDDYHEEFTFALASWPEDREATTTSIESWLRNWMSNKAERKKEQDKRESKNLAMPASAATGLREIIPKHD